jgi:hypothetical protein
MIHAEDYLVADREEVSRLAVTVVDDRIKKNDRTECNATSIYRINCTLHAEVFNPELHRPCTSWAVAKDRWRNDVEAERLTHLKGRNLTPGQRPIREVPERLFSADGLVDHL